MREDTRSELSTLLEKKNRMAQERGEFRVNEFESHLKFLETFASVQDTIIRPMMVNFGAYLESMGHRYFIETAQELPDGYLHPISRITFHLLLNENITTQHPVIPSFSYRVDNTKTVFVYKRIGTSATIAAAVGRYLLEAITKESVELHLKKFVIEAVST